MSFAFAPADPGDTPLPYEPRLSFASAAWRRLVAWTTRCPFEIGGLGLLTPDGDDLVVEEVVLVEQEVNDIATRLDGAAVHRLLVDLLDAGRDPAALKLWWHSHATEGVFWSGEDEETIDRFRNDFMVSLVLNHRLQALGRRDAYDPRRTTWVRVEPPLEAASPSPAELAEADREIAAKTRHRARASTRIF